MDATHLEELTTDRGRQVLTAVAEELESADPLTVASRLRRAHDPALVATALTQVDLRRRAREKLGDQAEAMFFTREGLEQATHGRIVRHRAHRFAQHEGSGATDLTCGIGVDAIGMMRSGLSVTMNDVDPLVARIATHNADALGLDHDTTVGDCTSYGLPAGDVHFLDPARRSATARTFDPDAYAPPWSFVEQVLRHTSCVKAAPGLPHARVPTDAEAEWASVDGSLKEVALWTGGLARRPGRRATVLRSRSPDAVTMHQDDTPGAADVRPLGRYLYDPDDAVTVAHLVDGLADLVAGGLVEEHLAYVTSDRLVDTAFGRAYEVVDVLPFKQKQLRAALRARGVGHLTIKKRGVHVTPERLRRELALTGDAGATVVLTRTPSSAVALLVEPRSSPSIS